jgi:hypothetical protein
MLEFEVVETRLSCTGLPGAMRLGKNILDDRLELQFEPGACLMIEGMYR